MSIDQHIVSQLVGNIYWKDLNGKYLGCNEAFAKMLGFESSKEVIGKSDADFIKNQLDLKVITKTDQLVVSSNKEHTLEEVGFDETGKMALYITKKAPLRDKNNNIIGVIGTSINLTGYFDIKDYVIRHTTGNVYWKDREGRYLGCNDALAEMLGLSSPSEVIGKTDYDLLHNTLDKEKIKIIVDIDQTVMNMGVEQTIEEIGIDKEGQSAVYITKKVPVRNSDNQVIGLVGNSLDITKQRQAEIAKLEFLRNMSHDIMTPFTGILGLSRALYEDETDAEKKLSLNYIIQSSDRLLHLFKQILEIAELGGRHLVIEEFNIQDIVRNTVEMALVSAKYKNLSVEINCPNQLIKSDKLRIARIVLNLLVNAIKFTEVGGIVINVQCDPYLKISVKDTGVGIPADKLEIIFEKFRKLTESGKNSNFMGSGIGLYIAKQFAIELGGDILVESEVGRGSTFTFYAKKKL